MLVLLIVVVWRIFFGVCSSYGDIELVEEVKKRFNEFDLDNFGDFVLLLNVYVIFGKWKDVVFIRKLMIVNKIKKVIGWSLVEVDKVMYKFIVGEKKKGKIIIEVYEKLKEIILRFKDEVGYVSEVVNVLYDIEEEEKED